MKRLGTVGDSTDERRGSDAAVKTCVRRFALSATGVRECYLACDLDEGLLRYWPRNPDPYRYLVFSPNIEERKLAVSGAGMRKESGRAVGVRLTSRQKKDIEEILSWENIESMRGIDNAYMADRCGGWCYRDGWSLNCYFEGDAGWPPLELENISYCSFCGEELPFEKLERYISSEVLHNQTEAFLYDVSYKARPRMAKKIVSQAIKSGMDAIEEILWAGSARLIEELDKTALDRELSYKLTDDCFTVRYGSTVSRACKLVERPACEKVFGREHAFGRAATVKAKDEE